MKLCDYGCGQEAKFPFKEGKWCCSKNWHSCPAQRKRVKELRKDPSSKYNSKSYKKTQSNIMKKIWEDPSSVYNSTLCKQKMSIAKKKAHKDPNSTYNSVSYKKNLSNSIRLNIKQINKKYPFFSKIEEMRYNPNKPLEEKEIQVHCKNHKCENSKEKGGWFTPTLTQIKDRKNILENEGEDKYYFYCSQYCKETCPLYNLHGDPYKDTNKPYTSAELEIFNKLVLKRDNEICYYCAKHHATIVHHLRPQKLEPFFALDPDYAISVCAKCHYKYGHPTGSKHSTGNLAKIVCSVESQKFLNQTLEDI
jgi:hypothetical protein